VPWTIHASVQSSAFHMMAVNCEIILAERNRLLLVDSFLGVKVSGYGPISVFYSGVTIAAFSLFLLLIKTITEDRERCFSGM